MPRVKHESNLIAVPAVLRLHPFWLASPLLNSTCKAFGNCIPFHIFKQVFEKADEIATRIGDLEGPTSPSAIAASTLCNNIQTAYLRDTGIYLQRTYSSKGAFGAASTSESGTLHI